MLGVWLLVCRRCGHVAPNHSKETDRGECAFAALAPVGRSRG